MRKFLILSAIIGCILSGCATDGAYTVAKTAVSVGKTTVNTLDIEVSDDVKKAYDVASGYDAVRTAVRTNTEKKLSSVDTNSTQIE